MFLGIEIKRFPDGSILAHQSKYAKKVIERLRLEDANPVCIPADPNTNFSNFKQKDSEVTSKKTNTMYKEAIGSLMHMANITRPDIAFAVGVLSRYAENPTQAHWKGIRVLVLEDRKIPDRHHRYGHFVQEKRVYRYKCVQ